MRQTLPQMPTATIPSKCDGTEQHLHPPKYRICFTQDTMCADRIWADRVFVDVEFQVDAKRELQTNRKEQDRGEIPVRRRQKLAAFM